VRADLCAGHAVGAHERVDIAVAFCADLIVRNLQMGDEAPVVRARVART
jgi:hypothetical protein